MKNGFKPNEDKKQRKKLRNTENSKKMKLS